MSMSTYFTVWVVIIVLLIAFALWFTVAFVVYVAC